MSVETIDWTCTDFDNYQFGAQVGENEYIFKEFDRFSIFPETVDSLEEAQKRIDDWVELYINLNNYSDFYKDEIARCYYGSMAELKEQCGDSWQWILAECIFEQECQLY